MSNYIRYRITRANNLKMEKVEGCWFLLDRDNGNPDQGRGYLWVFETREAARTHKAKQNAKRGNAQLVGPWDLNTTKEKLAHYRDTETLPRCK